MLVSVIIAVHNGGRFLAETLESVLRQSYRDFEVVAVDDGSTDETRHILDGYARQDQRLRVVRQGNAGPAAAANTGLAVARGSLIARIDADDLMMPQRLERQIAFLAANPDVAVAGSFVLLIDAHGRVVGRFRSPLCERAEFDRLVMQKEVPGFHHPSVMMRAEALRSIGGYREEFKVATDIDLWSRVIAAGYRIAVQPEYLTSYRIHARSLSVAKQRLQRETVEFIRFNHVRRLSGLPELDRRAFDEMRRRAPLLERANRNRTLWGGLAYKSAASAYANGNYAFSALWLAGALALRPLTTARQVRAKIAFGRSDLSRNAGLE